MSYAGMGQIDSTPGAVRVGTLATTDPIVSRASAIASQVMLKVSVRPREERKNLVRIYLNQLYPGMGDEAVKEIERLTARGADRNQAVFDGIRLAVANQLHQFVEKIVAACPMSGLGDTASDIRSVGCLVSGLSATAGGWTTLGGSSMAGASAIISSAAQAGANIQGCGIPAMQAQAEITRQQAQLAIQQANAASANNTRTMILIGGGVVSLIGLAIVGKVLLK
jgi:hypothetical protein